MRIIQAVKPAARRNCLFKPYTVDPDPAVGSIGSGLTDHVSGFLTADDGMFFLQHVKLPVQGTHMPVVVLPAVYEVFHAERQPANGVRYTLIQKRKNCIRLHDPAHFANG
jgi:hypothetical protein